MRSITAIPELDMLYQEVESYSSTQAYKDLLLFVKKFPDIAPYNALLIHIQNPGCAYALSARNWRQKYNRRVKPGAKPLVILQTFGPVSFVFDINETEGEAIPENILRPLTARGNVSKHRYDALVQNLFKEGIRLRETSYGSHLGGMIVSGVEQREHTIPVSPKKDAIVRTIFEIVLNSNHDLPTKFATILHELGHYYCGHCYNKKASWLPERYYLPHESIEFEAESVSWLVCQRLGITGPSIRYLFGYLDDHQQIPDISVDTVMKAAGKVERIATSIIPVRKDVLIKYIEK